jgi:hypothetical protein
MGTSEFEFISLYYYVAIVVNGKNERGEIGPTLLHGGSPRHGDTYAALNDVIARYVYFIT